MSAQELDDNSPLNVAFLRSFIRLRAFDIRPEDLDDAVVALHSLGITTARQLGEFRGRRPDSCPFRIWSALKPHQDGVSFQSVWDHLNTGLPALPYDEQKIARQKKSTTEWAAYSHTPVKLELWNDFDREIQVASTHARSTEMVRDGLENRLSYIEGDPLQQGMQMIVEEEDVTQNTVRILGLARHLLDLEFEAGNKYLTSNPDATVYVPDRMPAASAVTFRPNSAEDDRKRIKNRVRFSIETKPNWKYLSLSGDTQTCIIDQWILPDNYTGIDDDWTTQNKKIFHLIRQVYGQMKEDRLRHAVFHVYELWWFVQMVADGTLKVSRGFSRDATSPSVLQALMTLRLNEQHIVNGEIRKHAASPVPRPKRKRGRDEDDNDDNDDDGKKPRSSPRSAAPGPSSAVPPNRQSNAPGTSISCSTAFGSTDQQLCASKVELWDCTHLNSTEFTKTFSTKCGYGFVKIVIDPSMVHKINEMENEAKIYSYMRDKGASAAAPAYFGCSHHLGVPLLCVQMEGPDFDSIGKRNLSFSLRASAIEAVQMISKIGVWHGDLALRNFVQCRDNPSTAKIIDFGRSQVINDVQRLEAQVEHLKRFFGMDRVQQPLPLHSEVQKEKVAS